MPGSAEAGIKSVHKVWLQVLETILQNHLCLAYVVGLHLVVLIFSVVPFMSSKIYFIKKPYM